MFVLRPDKTFDYSFRTNAGTVSTSKETLTGAITETTDSFIFSDSSYGTYSLNGDTILLTYLTEEIKGSFNGHNIRPVRLLWKGKKLYYFFKDTGQVIRQKEHYMQWSRYKVANLYRFDEQYVPHR